MACFRPEQAFYGRGRTANGKRKLVFPRTEAGQLRAATVSGGEIVDLPCGKCEGCKLDRSQQWALRCEQEASLWKFNVFVTLTYSSENVPVTSGGLYTLRPDDFVLFMKRLRKSRGPGVRFLQAGEYGSLGRPHHHALLFNCNFPDKIIFREGAGKRARLYRSKELEQLWPMGFSSIGEVTYASAAYVARYTVKKFASVGVDEVRGGKVPDRAVVEEAGRGGREPEYMTMSLRPGIGRGWYEKYKGEVFPLDEVISREGRKLSPPRYYLSLLEREDPEGFAKVKAKRESRPDRDSYAVIVGGKLHTRLEARRELAIRKVKDYLKREV